MLEFINQLEAPVSATETTVSPVTTRRGGVGLRRLLISVGVAVALNLAVLAVLALVGADLDVVVPAGPGAITIDAVAVIVSTAVPLLVAGLIAYAITRRFPGLRRWAAWAGLALAVASLIAPLSLEADGATRAGLAVMHIVAGVAWFVALIAPDRTARPGA